MFDCGVPRSVRAARVVLAPALCVGGLRPATALDLRERRQDGIPVLLRLRGGGEQQAGEQG
jgi:hypothetical protein